MEKRIILTIGGRQVMTAIGKHIRIIGKAKPIISQVKEIVNQHIKDIDPQTITLNLVKEGRTTKKIIFKYRRRKDSKLYKTHRDFFQVFCVEAQ